MVFSFLLKRGAFAAGLDIECPSCELESWSTIDDLGTHMDCPLCGHRHNILAALRDRDWSYRCSGLFHQFHNQEGAVPVALLLQALDTNAGDGLCAFSTCLNLRLDGGLRCETDFLWVLNHASRATEVVLGEVKDQGDIEADDVNNLSTVAERLRSCALDAYVLFAKLTAFSDQEIAFCRRAQPEGEPRVVMLTQEDLEPYLFPRDSERHWAEIRLGRLAQGTHARYFAPEGTRPQ